MFFLHLGDFVPNELHAYRTTKKTLYIVPDPLAIELKKKEQQQQQHLV